MKQRNNRKIILPDGQTFFGTSFGAEKETILELVFNTSMAGYQEILSDPSYTDQAVVMTYPLIGNYGMAADDYESDPPSIGALIVREYNDLPSHYRSEETLGAVMRRFGIVGISGVDTRRLNRSIRDHGSRPALLTAAGTPAEEGLARIAAFAPPKDAVARVGCKAAYQMTYIVKTERNRKPNYAKLARQFNCDYRTVKQYYEAVSQGVKQLPERKLPKKTDGYEQIIEEKLKTGAPAIAIYHYLRDEKGFTGSYSTIKQYIHNYHRLQQHQAVIRFETTPGLQAQVDWKESLKFTTKSGEEIKFNVFLLILGFSRFKFLMVTESRDRMQVEFCLACAFKKIGGVPHEILFDNMRSIIDMARTQYADPVFNPEFLQFASDAGFKAKACMVYRPETKGKVEVTVKLMNRLKVYDGDIESFEDVKRIAQIPVVQLNTLPHYVLQYSIREPILFFSFL